MDLLTWIPGAIGAWRAAAGERCNGGALRPFAARDAVHHWRERSAGWPAMDQLPDNVIDVTRRLADALPDFVPDWTHARLYLVAGDAPSWTAHAASRPVPSRGGLSSGALRRIREYVERELATSIRLHDMAAVAGLSDCHFARAFKHSTGLTPHRYVMHRRLERAVDLIRKTDRPLSRIALEAGFCDQSHFSRLVARATGQTPRELRRQSGRIHR
jgi:AraC-like DNA-binding protein